MKVLSPAYRMSFGVIRHHSESPLSTRGGTESPGVRAEPTEAHEAFHSSIPGNGIWA